MLFNEKSFDATKQNMFLGEPVNVARYDQQRHPIFEKLIEKQLSFFWRPEEVDISTDAKQFKDMEESEKHVFTSNLKYQILLDSVQGRAPNITLLPIVSLPELETWIETWSFSETIHSRSYTHILRNLLPNPSEFFDTIVTTPEIVERAKAFCKYGDKLIDVTKEYENNRTDENLRYLKKTLYLYIMSVNILEAVRFYVSFACSFAFAERTLMEGNAKIIRLVSRDEALHLVGTQNILNLMSSGKDDPDMKAIAIECREESEEMFREAAEQEKGWSSYLFKSGSMLGLNDSILSSYVEYITNMRMEAVGLTPCYEKRSNPIPWINNWLNSDNVQVAPQEAEISSYLVGQVDATLSEGDFDEYDY